MKIIYPQVSGCIAILHPTNEIPVALVAEQDVPNGVPFLLVEDAEIPSDRSQRNGWVADFTNLDGVGGNYGAGTNWVVISRAEDGTPITLRNNQAEQEVLYVDHIN